MKKLILIFAMMPFCLKATELQLVGKALLEYSIFKIDIYEISYFKGQNNLEELVLDYKIDVKKKYSQEGWHKGLEPILKKDERYLSKSQWILENTVDLKKGDLYTIRKQNDHITLLKNSVILAEIEDNSIAQLVFYPWLGETPIDEDLKRKLLKNKEFLQ